MAANVDKALVHQVKNNAGVIALISSRFYAVNLPQTVTLPAAVYQSISGKLIKEHGVVTSLPTPRYQITCWSNQFDDVVELDIAIKAAIDGKRGTWGTGTYVTMIQRCQAESVPRHDRDPVTGLYWLSRDYLIMWTE